jgi:hypothetical protein
MQNNRTINVTIPPGTLSGNGYRVRLRADQPTITSSSNNSDITVVLNASNCSQPYLTSLLTNSCSTNNCPEGFNELIFINSGVGFTANSTSLRITYGNNSGIPYDADYTDVLTLNPTKISELNPAAGCPGLFVDGTNQAIPANAQIIFANTNLCDVALDWTGLRGQGPIYMVFNNDSEWSTSGNFINNTNCGNRYLNIIVTDNLGNFTTTEYWFNTANNTGKDGDFQNYSSQGGEAIFYGNQGSLTNGTTLLVELTEFNALVNNGLNRATWNTLSERNNAYFQLERRVETLESWETIAIINGAGNSSGLLSYVYADKQIKDILNYYRLKQVDFNGEFRYSQIFSTDNRIDRKIIGVFDILGRPIHPKTPGLKFFNLTMVPH